ncbi:protein-arginine deiminase [Geosmithia morbida]|uniref:Protein-arginine deiminase n=1 Tax=Geosmithia morbida TaxID=1094350 RepID=A0A9P5D6I7_9HYPO|nr:protein-arginine deiminase [Geosmithia morbida]KAF4125641.1 protein-arginine deiminase [Geosmithia morbida]
MGAFQPSNSAETGFAVRGFDHLRSHRSKSGVNYPSGCIIHGKHSDTLFLQPLRGLISSNAAGWLKVGHVGESIQFLPYDNDLGSFLPNSVNGVIFDYEYVGPNPFGSSIDGEDVFADAIRKAHAKAGVNATFVDDLFSHHSEEGEIHCGSNMPRQTDIPWWKQWSPASHSLSHAYMH